LADELTLFARLPEEDWERFRRLAGNRYRIQIKSEGGVRPLFLMLRKRRATLAGLLLFLALVYYQSLFLTEIQIEGYESISEGELREALAAAGFQEGAPKSMDIEEVKLALYREFEELVWVGVSYRGNLAVVSVAEGENVAPEVPGTAVCHVTARAEGFVEEVIAKEGLAVVEPGDYVREGDILISGIVPIEDKSYGAVADKPTERYVHAEGEVTARTFYNYLVFQEKYEIQKEPTGRKSFGLRLCWQGGSFDTAAFFRTESGLGKKQWRKALGHGVEEERVLLKLARPFAFSLSFVKTTEVELQRAERTQESIEAEARTQARKLIRKNLPENAEVVNNSLSFSSEENIIRVVVMLQALEEIGQEKTFTITIQPPEEDGAEGGTEELAESG
ncbi:MAG: sporulation protein YqfD, partial [Bacillota bacterium]|nr:sporulation protein YqfD [Bacillota bacterium]